MFNSVAGLFEFGISILNTWRDEKTKTLLGQTGDVGTETQGSDNVEMWQHVGIISRPPKAEPGKAACQGIVIKRGDHDVCIATRDVRGQELAGSIGYGETCVYAAGEDGKAQGRILLKGNGAVAIYTLEGNVAGGKSCTIQLMPDGSINLASQYGAIQLSKDQIAVVHQSGGGLAVKDGIFSVIAKQAVVNAGNVGLGAGVMTGVATQASLLPVLSAIATALDGILAALTSASGSSGTSGVTVGHVSAIGPSIATLKTSLATAFSKSVSAGI